MYLFQVVYFKQFQGYFHETNMDLFSSLIIHHSFQIECTKVSGLTYFKSQVPASTGTFKKIPQQTIESRWKWRQNSVHTFQILLLQIFALLSYLRFFHQKTQETQGSFLSAKKFSLRKRISKRGCGISLCKAMLSLNWITYKTELFAEQKILQKRLQNDLAFIKIVNQFAQKLNRYTKNAKSNLAP